MIPKHLFHRYQMHVGWVYGFTRILSEIAGGKMEPLERIGQWSAEAEMAVARRYDRDRMEWSLENEILTPKLRARYTELRDQFQREYSAAWIASQTLELQVEFALRQAGVIVDSPLPWADLTGDVLQKRGA